MNVRRFFRSRWVKIPLLLVSLLLLGGFGYLGWRLTTTTPAMYQPTETAAMGADGVAGAETIVYTTLRPSNWDVYLFDAPGETPRRLTEDPNLDYNAVLSGDGRWVVFVSERDGNANLYALDLTADSSPVRLTSHGAMDDAPSLSPDGTRLAFVSTRDRNPDIFVMPFAPGDAGAEERAFNLTNDPYGDFNPAFSPDGTRIAFSSNRAIFRRWNPLRLVPMTQALTNLYVIDADGSNLRRVAKDLGINGSPAWTEAGNELLFYRGLSETDIAVYRTNLDGGGTTRVSPEGLTALTPTAGPDGSVIFVGFDPDEPVGDEGGPTPDRHGGQLFRVEADGTGVQQLTDDGRMYLAPHYDAATGRLVAHGNGPVPPESRMANGTPFTWRGAVRPLALPDRALDLRPLRAYFPSLPDPPSRAVAIQWVHEHTGWPPGPSAIVSAKLDGEELTPLFPPADDGFMWTPVATRDGEWIFFSKGARFAGVGEDVDIWKVRADGTGAVNLTADSDANDAFPDVSADGRRVVFRSGRDGDPERGRNGNKEIYLMDANGDGIRRVSFTPGIETMPAISPDGKLVVYVTDRTGRGMKLWIQALEDPNDEGRLLEPERAKLTGLDMHPRFSPDGRWIVFTSDRAGLMDEWPLSAMYPQPYGELFAIPVDGSRPALRLTHDKWEDALAYWGRAPIAADSGSNR